MNDLITYYKNVSDVYNMSWLKRHLIEVAIGLVIAFGVWEAMLLLDLENRMIVVEVEVEHIGEAVNNTQPGEPTLREMVETLIENQSENPK